jgi:hypothetical protein
VADSESQFIVNRNSVPIVGIRPELIAIDGSQSSGVPISNWKTAQWRVAASIGDDESPIYHLDDEDLRSICFGATFEIL